MPGRTVFVAVILFALGAMIGVPIARGQVITVPNNSFESPTVTPAQVASPFFGNVWQSTGPVLTDVGGGLIINENTGIFPNTASGQPDSIDNVDGTQAAYIGAQTGNEISQMLTTTFAANNSYQLTIAVAHSFGQPPAATAEVRLELFYLDAESNRQIVASTDVFNDAATALSANHLKDFSTPLTLVGNASAAVGQPIGVLMTTIGPAGGFFDLDNVRLVPEPGTCFGVLGAIACTTLTRRSRRRLSQL